MSSQPRQSAASSGQRFCVLTVRHRLRSYLIALAKTGCSVAELKSLLSACCPSAPSDIAALFDTGSRTFVPVAAVAANPSAFTSGALCIIREGEEEDAALLLADGASVASEAEDPLNSSAEAAPERGGDGIRTRDLERVLLVLGVEPKYFADRSYAEKRELVKDLLEARGLYSRDEGDSEASLDTSVHSLLNTSAASAVAAAVKPVTRNQQQQLSEHESSYFEEEEQEDDEDEEQAGTSTARLRSSASHLSLRSESDLSVDSTAAAAAAAAAARPSTLINNSSTAATASRQQQSSSSSSSGTSPVRIRDVLGKQTDALLRVLGQTEEEMNEKLERDLRLYRSPQQQQRSTAAANTSLDEESGAVTEDEEAAVRALGKDEEEEEEEEEQQQSQVESSTATAAAASSAQQAGLSTLEALRQATGLAYVEPAQILHLLRTFAPDGTMTAASLGVFSTRLRKIAWANDGLRGLGAEEERYRRSVFRSCMDALATLARTDRQGEYSAQKLATGLSLLCGGDEDSKLRLAFAALDVDRDGKVSKQELEEYVFSFFMASHVFEVSDIVEVVAAASQRRKQQRQQQPSQRSDTGLPRISISALTSLARSTADYCFREADMDRDGYISFDEFRTWFLSSHSLSSSPSASSSPSFAAPAFHAERKYHVPASSSSDSSLLSSHPTPASTATAAALDAVSDGLNSWTPEEEEQRSIPPAASPSFGPSPKLMRKSIPLRVTKAPAAAAVAARLLARDEKGSSPEAVGLRPATRRGKSAPRHRALVSLPRS